MIRDELCRPGGDLGQLMMIANPPLKRWAIFGCPKGTCKAAFGQNPQFDGDTGRNRLWSVSRRTFEEASAERRSCHRRWLRVKRITVSRVCTAIVCGPFLDVSITEVTLVRTNVC